MKQPTRKRKVKPSKDELIDKSIDIMIDGLEASKSKIDQVLLKSHELLKNC